MTSTAKFAAAKAKVASQIKVAAGAMKQMKAAAKANDLKTAAEAYKKLFAANVAADAASDEAGIDLSDKQMNALGYLKLEGGCWGLDIPMPVLDYLVDSGDLRFDDKKNS